MLLRGLELSSQTPSSIRFKGPTEQQTKLALKQRRYLARLLEAMLHADPELTKPVLTAMAAHGIRPGATNDQLKDLDLAAHLHGPTYSDRLVRARHDLLSAN
jgi:hypothetical protein